MKQYVFTILFTAIVTFSLSWAVWRLSTKYKLYPGIRERDVHKTPTPRLGGIAMFFGVVAAIAVSAANPFFSIFWAEAEEVYAILAATEGWPTNTDRRPHAEYYLGRRRSR